MSEIYPQTDTARTNGQVTRMSHSGLGIASFVTSMVSLVIVVSSFGVMVAAALEGSPPSQGIIMVVGMLIIVAIIGALIGLGLSIFDLRNQETKNTFAIAGLVISSAILLVAILMIFIHALKR